MGISEQSGDPLIIMQVIKTCTIPDRGYVPISSVYEQEQTLYTFHQNDLTNDQWHENFNTWSDVVNATGVIRKHRSLLEHLDQEKQS